MSEWTEDFLENLVNIDKEQLNTSTNPDFTFFYIDISSVSTNKIQIPNLPILFRESPSRARKVIHHDDILMSTVRPNLKAFARFRKQTDDNYIASTGFVVLSKKENICIDFIFYALLSCDVEKQIETLVVGSNYPALNTSDIKKLRIKFPNENIQKYISKSLSVCDNVIEKTQQALSKYKSIKQGMLNDLFTRGIDVETGKLRPNYKDAPHLYKESPLGMVPKEWEVVRLKMLAERISVGIATSSSDSFAKEGILFLRNQNIKENRIDLSDVIYITKEFADLNGSKYLKKGDVITVRTGYPGISAVVEQEFENSQTFTTLITTPNSKVLNSYFLSNFLNSNFGKDQVLNLQGGGAQQNLNSGALETMWILKPSLNEQNLIVGRLSVIEDNIHAEQSYLSKLQQLKTGLMGDLLSGKKEVKIEGEDKKKKDEDDSN